MVSSSAKFSTLTSKFLTNGLNLSGRDASVLYAIVYRSARSGISAVSLRPLTIDNLTFLPAIWLPPP
ncbi:hypothetical protein ID47_01980 [Candidatus Paracaedibacter acanthamoebae]|uniref:Uncharacterized protein n=1 Tax=Candidatus Odyssella acanthamoebae TaxID=91604 RepID=A0A077AUQ9_9PROT|nr:hypothetical protein ID47_01980 [Candidatus Paracaedibacter acanthamoebae]